MTVSTDVDGRSSVTPFGATPIIMAKVDLRWFTEGFDTADLKDAKALIEELRNSH